MSRVQSLLMSQGRQAAKNVAADPDARFYINAVRNADGGLYMEVGVQRAIDAFVVGCKADGIWGAIKASCILAGARTLAGALVPLVGTAPTNNNFVSGDYDRKTGLVGDGATKYLNANRNCNADPQDSVHLGIYGLSVAAINRIYLGAGAGTVSGTTQLLSAASLGGASRGRARTATASSNGGIDAAGFKGAARSAAASFVTRASGTNTTTALSSTSPFSGNYFVFASNNGAAAANFADARIAFYSIGESLDLALLDSRVSALITAIGDAIP